MFNKSQVKRVIDFLILSFLVVKIINQLCAAGAK